MTQTKRIILNIIVTYGRTVVGVLCGIFSTRWVLMALGKEDFGLFGLVGSLVIFLSFFNTQFAGALSRFYAFAVGQAKVSANAEQALEECRKWFSVGVSIHTIIPLALVAVGYPIGVWAINAGVVGVPGYRIGACVWLWRFVCISSLMSMVNVPFSAMYTAKQYIAELTVYSLAQTLVRTIFIYCMTLRQGDWLVVYGFATCLIMVVPQIIICVRAMVIFPECHFRLAYATLGHYVSRLASYAGWQTFGGLGYLARHQFLTIVVNRAFGPIVTASFSIAATVSAEAAALTGALNTAFSPAITTVCGEGDWGRTRKMGYQASKFGTLLTLLFAIPMGLEMGEVLRLWLKDVPEWSEVFCIIMLAVVVVEKFSLGHIISVNASGRVAKFQICRGLVCLTAIPFSVGAVFVFHNCYAVPFALLATTILACISDVWLARGSVGLSVSYWLCKTILPIGFVCVITGLLGYSPHYIMAPSLFRVCITVIVSTFCLTTFSWYFVLSHEEKLFIANKWNCLVSRNSNGLRRG